MTENERREAAFRKATAHIEAIPRGHSWNTHEWHPGNGTSRFVKGQEFVCRCEDCDREFDAAIQALESVGF